MTPLDIKCQAWGSTNILDVKDMVKTNNSYGVRFNNKLYVVEEHHVESLLGDNDTENLGFMRFTPQRRIHAKEATINRNPKMIR